MDRLEVLGFDHEGRNARLLAQAQREIANEVLDELRVVVSALGDVLFIRALEDAEHLATAADSALLTELSSLTDKIRVAIAIHTDAVSRTQMVRRKFIVRIFRLAGTAPLPITYEFETDVL